MANTETKKKKIEEAIPLETEKGEVIFWHKGRAGMVSYEIGIDQFTRKPISKEIKFINHRYPTSDPDEIKALDTFGEKTKMVRRLDEYKQALAQEPKFVVMEINGKKVKIPLSALKDSYAKDVEEEMTGGALDHILETKTK